MIWLGGLVLIVKLVWGRRTCWLLLFGVAQKIKKMVEDWILDYVAVDLKGPLSNYEKRCGIVELNDFFENYKALLDFLKSWTVDYEYRSTLIKWFHTKDDIEEMWMYINWIKMWYLQNFLPEETLDPNFEWEPFSAMELQDGRATAQEGK